MNNALCADQRGEADPSTAPRAHRARRRVVAFATVAIVLILTAGVGVLGLYGAGQREAELATAIRSGAARTSQGLPLSLPQVSLSPRWMLPWSAASHGPDLGALSVRIEDVALSSGATATATLSAAHARWSGGTVQATDGQVTIELGADALGRPLGLRSAYLTAFSDGSLAGAEEDRARLAGRLVAPSPDIADLPVAWEVQLHSPTAEPGTPPGVATATVLGDDRSPAGRKLRGDAGDAGDTATALPELPPPGTQFRFDAGVMPLDLPPEHISVRARTVTLTARFAFLEFDPAALAAPRHFNVQTSDH